MRKALIWSLEIDLISFDQTLDLIEQAIISKTITQHVVVNAAKIVNSQNNELLRRAINNSDIVNIDGMPVVWALRLLGYEVPQKVSGVDLFLHLLELSSSRGYRPFFLGAKSEVLHEMVQVAKATFPSLNIAGYRDGYFTESEGEIIAAEIIASNADMLFLGITSPKKELFIDKYSKQMKIPFVMGVGGSFDILAGRSKRAPVWMQRGGLEWLYRIYQEPGRMWKRYATTNIIFVIMVFKELVRIKVFGKKISYSQEKYE